MRVNFITKLYNMIIEGPTGRGIRFGPSLYISNDVSIARDMVAEIKPFIGLLESNDLTKDSTSFMHGQFQVPEGFDINEESIQRIVKQCLIKAQVMINFLWLIRDNAVRTELGFAWITDNHGRIIGCASNMLYLGITSASGDSPVTSFTLDELRFVRDIASRVYHNGKSMLDLDPLVDEVSPVVFPQDEDVSRIDLTFFTLQMVRSTSYIPSKIAGYCTCFETLLSAEGTELSHRIAERLAWLLGNDVTERLELYQRAKKAYDIRSRTVHGSLSQFGFRSESLASVSQWCDQTLRRILLLTLSDKEMFSLFNGPPDRLREWFNKLCLGEYHLGQGNSQMSSV